MTRISLYVFGILTAFTFTSVWADNTNDAVRVRVLSNLKADSALMLDKRLPMVVEMAASDCPFCEQIEEFVLRPMIMSGEYEEKILLRKVDIHESLEIKDIDGGRITQSGFADRYGVSLTPTVLFLDHQGKELAPRMVGVSLIDFYGLYLDQHIDAARSAINQ